MTLIALDLDGTLEDSRADMVAAARRVRATLGLPPRPDAALRCFVNQGMDALYRNCFDDYLGGEKSAERYREAQKAYDADYMEHVADETRLYDGIAAALKELSALGRLACVTNKPEMISRKLLDVLDVGKYIRVVVGGDSCGAVKPDPTMLLEAARRSGLRPSAAPSVMIGDTAGDIQMGRAFGAATVWCAWGYSDALGAESPDFEARTPAELAEHVRAALGLPRQKELERT